MIYRATAMKCHSRLALLSLVSLCAYSTQVSTNKRLRAITQGLRASWNIRTLKHTEQEDLGITHSAYFP
jgi:hypothetical protein